MSQFAIERSSQPTSAEYAANRIRSQLDILQRDDGVTTVNSFIPTGVQELILGVVQRIPFVRLVKRPDPIAVTKDALKAQLEDTYRNVGTIIQEGRSTLRHHRQVSSLLQLAADNPQDEEAVSALERLINQPANEALNGIRDPEVEILLAERAAEMTQPEKDAKRAQVLLDAEEQLQYSGPITAILGSLIEQSTGKLEQLKTAFSVVARHQGALTAVHRISGSLAETAFSDVRHLQRVKRLLAEALAIATTTADVVEVTGGLRAQMSRQELDDIMQRAQALLQRTDQQQGVLPAPSNDG